MMFLRSTSSNSILTTLLDRNLYVCLKVFQLQNFPLPGALRPLKVFIVHITGGDIGCLALFPP